MLPGKAQASAQPTAIGTLTQASTYGMAIPKIYGCTLSPLLAIWAANLRQGPSDKKFKNFIAKLKGQSGYIENIDFLLGSNPIIGVLQLWNNGATIPLEFFTCTTTSNPFVEVENSGSGPWLIWTAASTPDPLFYAVVGITVPLEFTTTFDDYGSNAGPVTVTSSYVAPLWNARMKGPNPNDTGAFKYWPLVYQWDPTDGIVINPAAPGYWFGGPTPTVYIARVTPATSDQGPLLHNRLTFEPQLGDGPEYTGNFDGTSTPLSTQQNIYPMFAGIGSADIDLGSSGALPSLTAEVQGAFGTYSQGDADFADMIEDIVKSGITQAAIGAGSAPALTSVETGLSCYDMPGIVQKFSDGAVSGFLQGPETYPLNVTKGNFLVVFADGASGVLSISDSLTNTWTAVFPGSPTGYQAWYAQANASGQCTVTVTSSISGWGDWQMALFEIAGVDTFDNVAIGNAQSLVSIATSGAQGFPGYLLNLNAMPLNNSQDPRLPLWKTVMSNNNFYFPFPATISGGGTGLDGFSVSSHLTALEQRVYGPGTYSVQQNTSINSSLPGASAVLAFKCVNPPTYPKPVGDFMDPYSLDQVRHQCRANGLIGSLSMNSQQAASDWLKTIGDAADCAFVFCGFQLFTMPLSEVSAVGGGAVYQSLTSAGPSFNLSTENGDFVPTGDDPPIKIVTAARVDQPNVLQMQCLNRGSNYNPSVVAQPDAASISLFGVRKADPIQNYAVQDVQVARQLLGIQVRKLQYGGDVITFTLPARWCLLAPYGAGGGGLGNLLFSGYYATPADAVITISDPLASISNLPVRITSTTEQPSGEIECEAELFVYGMYAPTVFSTDTPAPFQGNPNTPVGAGINPPIIFEAVPRLAAQTSPSQIWIVTSCAAAGYGGCVPYVSTDGGSSYTLVSDTPITGSGTQGVSTADWPSSSDPDTTNNLALSLVESAGELVSYTAQQRDAFQFPCYIKSKPSWAATTVLALNYEIIDSASHIQKVTTAGTTGSTFPNFNESGGTTSDGSVTWTDQGVVAIPYELMTYNDAVLIGTDLYTLTATGGGNELRRGVFGAPTPGVGVDHPSGSDFAFLDPAATGIVKINMDPAWIGVKLYFKFPTFNTFGGSTQALSEAVAYPFTPTGSPGNIGAATGGIQVNGS